MSEAAVIELITMLEAQPQSPTDEDWYERALCPQTDPRRVLPPREGRINQGSQEDLPRLPGQTAVPAMGTRPRRALRNLGGGLSERERRRLKRGIDIRPAQDDEPERVAAIAAANGYDQDARLAG